MHEMNIDHREKKNFPSSVIHFWFCNGIKSTDDVAVGTKEHKKKREREIRLSHFICLDISSVKFFISSSKELNDGQLSLYTTVYTFFLPSSSSGST